VTLPFLDFLSFNLSHEGTGEDQRTRSIDGQPISHQCSRSSTLSLTSKQLTDPLLLSGMEFLEADEAQSNLRGSSLRL
jgi:hypothetical protein